MRQPGADLLAGSRAYLLSWSGVQPMGGLGIHAPEHSGIDPAGWSSTHLTGPSSTRPTERLGVDPMGGSRVHRLRQPGADLLGGLWA
ncbi:MAG: hypothetical protein OXB90_02975, partial [Acidimicrobiaceae bacterium]|nr:hypothetical protein [Acidimicrobiaceae bacterium]